MYDVGTETKILILGQLRTYSPYFNYGNIRYKVTINPYNTLRYGTPTMGHSKGHEKVKKCMLCCAMQFQVC